MKNQEELYPMVAKWIDRLIYLFIAISIICFIVITIYQNKQESITKELDQAEVSVLLPIEAQTPTDFLQDYLETDLDSEPAVVAVAGQIVTYWLEPGGYMAEISSAETHRRIKEAFTELEDVCAVRFTQVTKGSRAKVRIYFKPQDKIKYGALGLAYVNRGYLELNNTRKVGLTKRWSRVCQSVVQHEMLHMLWTPLHSKREDSIMHWANVNSYFDRQDVINLQKVFGRNTGRSFRPFTLAKAGTLLRESTARYNKLWKDRLILLGERDSSTDKAYRTAKQMQILDNLVLIIAEIPTMIVDKT